MKQFLKDLKKELTKLKFSENEIKEILADHEEMIQVAIDEGLLETELEQKFGVPKKVAQELSDDSKKTGEEGNPSNNTSIEGYTFFNSFPVTDEVIDVNISVIDEDVEYVSAETSSIEVFYQGIDDIEKYDISLKAGIFKIRCEKRGISFFMKRRSPKFIVKFPMGMKNKLFNYKTVSGDAIIYGVSTDEFTVKTTSGDMKIEKLDSKEFKLSSVSGDITISNLKAIGFKVSLVSGDMNMINSTIENDMDVNTVSGDAKIKDTSATNTSIKTVSGDLNAEEFYPKTVSLKSVSGDINIKNKLKDKEIKILHKKTLSGNISIN